MNLKFRLGFMIGLPIIVAALFAYLIYGEQRGVFNNSTPPTTAVMVSSNVSKPFQQASLNLAISEYAPFSGKWYGSRSLGSPLGSGEEENETNYLFDEERLTAITQDGFEVRFTRRQCPNVQTNNVHYHQIGKMIVQTNTVLFRFGTTTETNTLGLSIVGKFE